MHHSQLIDTIASGRSAKNTRILNPTTGDFRFGYIPENPVIDSGHIYLCLGYDGFGPDRRGAFGARHIWDKHQVDLNLTQFADVPHTVASILTEGCNVLVDQNKGGPTKPIVINTPHGMVSLQHKLIDNVPEYHVLTAYGRNDHPGTVVAQLSTSTRA